MTETDSMFNNALSHLMKPARWLRGGMVFRSAVFLRCRENNRCRFNHHAGKRPDHPGQYFAFSHAGPTHARETLTRHA